MHEGVANPVNMIHFSPSARAEIDRLRQQAEIAPATPLALRILPGGCQGKIYDFDLKPAPAPEDCPFDCGGLSVLISPQHFADLSGVEIDYSEDLVGGGFRFRNPNAIQTCSCSLSFATELAN